MWNSHLHKGLSLKLNWIQSKTHPCLYYRRDHLLTVYIDYCILIAKTEKLIAQEMAENFEITVEGELLEAFELKVEKLNDQRITST